MLVCVFVVISPAHTLTPPPLSTPAVSSDDKQELLHWTAAIHRDRYHVVRDERDAYQSLQQSFSGELAHAAKDLEQQQGETQAIMTQAAQAQVTLDDCLQAMQRVLLALGVSEGELRSCVVGSAGAAGSGPPLAPTSSAAAYCERAVSAIRGIREQQEAEMQAAQSAHKESEGTHLQRINELERQVQGAEADTALLSKQMNHAVEAAQVALEDAQRDHEHTRSELSLVAASARAAEERSSELQGAKRLLAKEVKSLRKRLEESEAKVAKVQGDHERVQGALQQVMMQKTSLLQRIAEYDERSDSAAASAATAAATSHRDPSSSGVGSDTTATATAALSGGTDGFAAQAAPSGEMNALGTPEREANPTNTETNTNTNTDTGTVTSSGSSLSRATRILRPEVGEEVDAIRRLSGLASTPSSTPPSADSSAGAAAVGSSRGDNSVGEEWSELKQMRRLAPEQREAIQGRKSVSENSESKTAHAQEPDAEPEQPAAAVALTVANEGRALASSLGFSSTPSPAEMRAYEKANKSAAATAAAAAAANRQNKTHRRSSLQVLQSMLSYDPNAPPRPPIIGSDERDDDDNGVGGASGSVGRSGGVVEGEAGDALGAAEASHSAVPQCQRCGGTVEGPKYSTCKCKLPLMQSQAQQAGGGIASSPTASAMLSGMSEGLGSALSMARRASMKMGSSMKYPGVPDSR